MHDHSDAKDTIDGECNPNIRRLTVHGVFNHPLASYIKYLLSCLSAPNIQQITFEIVLLWPHNERNWQGWNEVDQVLDGVKFRGLREVAIVLDTYPDMDPIHQHLTDQFPSMYGKGILDIRRL